MENKRVPRTHYLRVDTTKHISCSFHRGKRKKRGKKRGEKREKIEGKKEWKKKSNVCTLRQTRELAFEAGIDTDRIDETEPVNVPQSIPRINSIRSIFMNRAWYATSKTEFNFAAGDIHVSDYICTYIITCYVQKI